MNGDKPLNIPADPEIKPDIEVVTKPLAPGEIPVPPSPPASVEKPQTPLQAALTSTITKVVPPKPGAPTPTSPQSTDPSVIADKKSMFDGFKNFLQKPIRTYESDIADMMAKRNTSVATIAIAEAEKKEQVQSQVSGGVVEQSQEQPKRAWKKIFLGTISIIFIGGGIVGGYYLYTQSALNAPPPPPQQIVIRSLIPSETQEILMVDGLVEEGLVAEIKSRLKKESSLKAGISELILGKKKGEESVRISRTEFMEKAGIEMPDALSRALTDQWMLGSYTNEQGSKNSFIVFKTDFFQNAFAGMLSWEPLMPDAFGQVLNFEEKARSGDNAGTSTIASYFTIRGTFVDKQVMNRDVREFLSRTNETLFMYSFIDKDTLVITTSEEALRGILEQVEKQTYVR